jgi:hypothetical protein
MHFLLVWLPISMGPTWWLSLVFNVQHLKRIECLSLQ